MEFNKFIWNNYKESKEGHEVIEFFEEGDLDVLMRRFITVKNKFIEENISFVGDLLETVKIPDDIGNDEILEYIIENGLKGYEDGKQLEFFIKEDFSTLLNSIEPLSVFLFTIDPNLYFPYFFQLEFAKFQKICDIFNINIPVVPIRKNKKDRVIYYLELCNVFNEFKELHNLNAFEFCAFIYDFAPKFIGEEKKYDLPEPTNIWLCGGAKDDYPYLIKSDKATTYYWQGNEDTKKGDIIVMYCLSPQSNFEFICRAVNDGICDPFFHYYGSITLGQIKHITPINISQIKTDDYLKNLPIVRKNLQGVNGTRLNNEDFKRILHLLEEKGEDISKLPRLSSIDFKANDYCKNEREVEIKMVEPLLLNLNYTENDWIRQLSVRMGRGERNYPDYVFFAETKKGYERGKMLLETKFFIKNNKELEDSFQQAHSYALRLESKKIVICDKEYLWIYSRINDSFDRTQYSRFNWQEIDNPDKFNQIKRIIGKEFI